MGDLHLERWYKAVNSSVADVYRQVRLDALDNIIQIAGNENGDYMGMAGDLFDNYNLPSSLISTVCTVLNKRPCPVLIIPSNQD